MVTVASDLSVSLHFIALVSPMLEYISGSPVFVSFLAYSTTFPLSLPLPPLSARLHSEQPLMLHYFFPLFVQSHRHFPVSFALPFFCLAQTFRHHSPSSVGLFASRVDLIPSSPSCSFLLLFPPVVLTAHFISSHIFPPLSLSTSPHPIRLNPPPFPS